MNVETDNVSEHCSYQLTSIGDFRTWLTFLMSFKRNHVFTVLLLVSFSVLKRPGCCSGLRAGSGTLYDTVSDQDDCASCREEGRKLHNVAASSSWQRATSVIGKLNLSRQKVCLHNPLIRPKFGNLGPTFVHRIFSQSHS